MEPEGSLPVHKSLPPVPILSQMNPFHTLTPYFSKIQFNVVLLSMPRSPSGLFPSGFQTEIVYVFEIAPMHAACFAHLILLDLITLTVFD
jgi:hypothetical protein